MTEQLRQADREARRAAQREFEAPIVLEAGAGTGKTTTLVARILTWCLGPGWDLHAASAPEKEPPKPDLIAAKVLGGVVAITFTEAAAAEMAHRVGTEMAALGQGEFPSWLWTDPLPGRAECQRRGQALTAALDHLAIRTIHAFCRSLLASNPLEAGLHPILKVDADGSAVELAAREIVEEKLQTAYGDPGEASFLALAALGVGPEDLVEALVRLAQEGAHPSMFVEDPLSPARVATLRSRLEEALEPCIAAALPALGNTSKRSKMTFQVLDALTATQDRLAALEEMDSPANLEAFCQHLQAAWQGSPLSRLRDWGEGKINASETAAIGDGAKNLQRTSAPLASLLAHAVRLQPALLAHAREVLSPLLEEVRRLLGSRGVVTFTDLLLEARNLLASQEGVRQRIRRTMDQLLVDEFQDTDPTQCDLVRWLSLKGPAEERPGLFLVGDPKQSIYGWRSADLEAYHGFVEEIRDAGGQHHFLSQNFRSVPAVIQEVERCLAPIMREERGVQPAFQPLLACERLREHPGFHAQDWRPIEYWISWERQGDPKRSRARTRSQDAARIEASAVARDLLRLRQEHNTQWNDVALLLRSTGNLDVYLDALRRCGIPFAVGRDKQYYRRREIIEAAALVRCVLDPGDQMALLTWLRSPMVGVPDAALIPLWSGQLPRLMMELDLVAIHRVAREAAHRLPSTLPGLHEIRGWEANLVSAAEHLQHLREAYRTEPATIFVDLLRRLSFQEVLESGRYLGRYRLANLQRFFRQLLEALESGSDVPSLLRLLRRAVSSSQDAEEGRPGGNTEAVQVMTIHGSKGLGFEHVYLLELHKKDPAHKALGTTIRILPEGTEYSLFGSPSLGFDSVLTAQRLVEQAERIRLLYVAMTRAKQRLVLAGCWPESIEVLYQVSREDRGVTQARTLLELLSFRSPTPPNLGELADRFDNPEALNSESAETDSGGTRPVETVSAEAAGASWVFLAAEDHSESPAESTPVVLPDLESVRAKSQELMKRRRKAEQYMKRPWNTAASKVAHSALEEASKAALAATGAPDEDAGLSLPENHLDVNHHDESYLQESWANRRDDHQDGSRESDDTRHRDRDIAMAVGTAIHRVLETLDLRQDPEQSRAFQMNQLPLFLKSLVDPELLPNAIAKAEDLLGRCFESQLLQRFQDLEPHILARELPLLLPPGAALQEPSTAGTEEGPVKFISGTIDLLYTDPVTGSVVIADYKTDEIHNDQELTERAAVYASQGRIYQQAVQEALDLPKAPRFELWFLPSGPVEIVLPET